MILYLDTSALVKLFIEETHSEQVQQAVQQSEAVATHWLAYVETHAAFARLSREGVINSEQLEQLQRKFELAWENYLRLEIIESHLYQAAHLAQNFGLCAYDAVHLAAAEFLLKESGEVVTFSCFDKRLNNAAIAQGLTTLMPSA
jgi:predicted nucleic acid-binding protein